MEREGLSHCFKRYVESPSPIKGKIYVSDLMELSLKGQPGWL